MHPTTNLIKLCNQLCFCLYLLFYPLRNIYSIFSNKKQQPRAFHRKVSIFPCEKSFPRRHKQANGKCRSLAILPHSLTHVPSLFCSIVLFSLSPMDDDNTPSFHVQPKSKRAKNPHPRAYIYHKNRVCLHIFIIIDGDT